MPTAYPDLAGKVALVTGAGEGIGRAIAAHLVGAGAHVVLNDLDGALAAAAAADLTACGPGTCTPVGGDAGDLAVIDRLVATAYAEYDRLDLICPNAGVTLFGDFFAFTPEHYERVTDINLRGAFFLVQRGAAAMRARGTGGRVLLMSSNVGVQAYPDLTLYAMTKAALRMMARNLVVTLGPLGIAINVVAPGATLTPRTRSEQPDYAGVWGELMPDGRVGYPEDVARTALFLLSEASAHVNGQTIVVDGGWVATSEVPG